jgi:transposase
MRAYSLDLRERVLSDCAGGLEVRQAAAKYRVSESWIRRLRQRHAETGETEPRSCCNGRQAKWLSYADRLQQLVQERPDATLAELAAALEHELSPQSIWRALRALKLSFKKSRSRGRARSA